MSTNSLMVYPYGYDTGNYSYSSVSIIHPLSDAVGATSSSTDYAQWNLTTGSQAESYVYYTFDLSSIPDNATINSVTCIAKGYISNASYNNVRLSTMQLYSGTTAMGAATTLTTSAIEYTMTCGTWTRSQLNDCKIKIYAMRGTKKTTTTYYNRFYGATLTVNYTVAATMYTVTASCNNGGTLDHSGNTSVEAGSDYLVTITPDAGYDVGAITSNGTNVKQDLVANATGYTYSEQAVSENIIIVVTFVVLPSGMGVYYKQNATYSEVAAVYQKIEDTWMQILKNSLDRSKRYAIIEAPIIDDGSPYELSVTFGDNITSATASFDGANSTNLPSMVSVETGTLVRIYGRYPMEVTTAYININGTNRTMTITPAAFYKTATYSFDMPPQDVSIVLYGITSGTGGGEIM